MSNGEYFLEASTSRCKKQMQVLSTTSKSSENQFQEDVKRRRRKAEIKQLDGRLRLHEQEAEMLKGALLESVEESKKLITEIHHHFNTVKRRLSQTEELYSRLVQKAALHKDRRAGLLQVLCQESNPSIVNKSIRTKALGEAST